METWALVNILNHSQSNTGSDAPEQHYTVQHKDIPGSIPYIAHQHTNASSAV